jgi:hypothetical protein
MLGIAGAGGARILPTEAARRGYSGTVSICNPTGNGDYAQMTVAAALLSGYLAAGAVVSNGCCAHGDCAGDACSTGVCDHLTGICQTAPVANDTPCTPNGPVNLCQGQTTCQEGICTPGIVTLCAHVIGGCEQLIGCNPSTGLCEYEPVSDGSRCNRDTGCVQGFCASGVCLDPPAKICTGDACRMCSYDACNDSCICLHVGCAGDPDCQHSFCDPQIGCVFESINEGETCSGVNGGSCFDGQCVA